MNKYTSFTAAHPDRIIPIKPQVERNWNEWIAGGLWLIAGVLIIQLFAYAFVSHELLEMIHKGDNRVRIEERTKAYEFMRDRVPGFEKEYIKNLK